MTEPGILGAFQSHAFLANLSRQHLLVLASGVKPFSAAAGEYLAKEGETANAFFLVQEGHVAINMHRPDRNGLAIQTIGPGEVIGWSWVVPGQRWQFDCQAGDAVKGLAFDAHWLRERCEQDHELGYHLLKQMVAVLSSRLAATRGQLSHVPK